MADRQVAETWNEYRRLVITELESLKRSNDDICDRLDTIRTEIMDKIDKKNDEYNHRVHALDLRVNQLETKMYIISSCIGTITGLLVTLGKAILEHYF